MSRTATAWLQPASSKSRAPLRTLVSVRSADRRPACRRRPADLRAPAQRRLGSGSGRRTGGLPRPVGCQPFAKCGDRGGPVAGGERWGAHVEVEVGQVAEQDVGRSLDPQSAECGQQQQALGPAAAPTGRLRRPAPHRPRGRSASPPMAAPVASSCPWPAPVPRRAATGFPSPRPSSGSEVRLPSPGRVAFPTGCMQCRFEGRSAPCQSVTCSWMSRRSVIDAPSTGRIRRRPPRSTGGTALRRRDTGRAPAPGRMPERCGTSRRGAGTRRTRRGIRVPRP